MKTKSEKTINFCLKIIGVISGILTIITFIQMKTELTTINWLFIIFLLTFFICCILLIRAKWLDSINKITSDMNTIKENNNSDMNTIKENNNKETVILESKLKDVQTEFDVKINTVVFGERMNDFIENNETIKKIKKSNEPNNP